MADRVLNMVAVRYFQEVARAGSFRRAGERINVAASAINRHVRLLEEELGVKLLDRGRGRSGVTLTAAGEILIRRVGYALNELQVAREEIKALQGRQSHQVSLGTTDALAKDLAPEIISKFHGESPDVTFDTVVDTPERIIEMLLEDKLDMAVLYEVQPQIEIRFVAEYAFGSAVVVRKDHPFAGRRMVSLAECAAYPLAMASYRSDLLQRMATELGEMPSPFVRTNSYELMRDLVQAGMAISFQSNLPMHRESHPDLTYVPLNEPLARYSLLTLCVRKGRRLSFSAQIFLRSVEDYLDGEFRQCRLKHLTTGPNPHPAGK